MCSIRNRWRAWPRGWAACLATGACSSAIPGAEANEAAIKLARRWGHGNGGRFEIVSTLGSFHGRTMGTLSATGQEKYHQGFQPLLPGFKLVDV